MISIPGYGSFSADWKAIIFPPGICTDPILFALLSIFVSFSPGCGLINVHIKTALEYPFKKYAQGG